MSDHASPPAPPDPEGSAGDDSPTGKAAFAGAEPDEDEDAIDFEPVPVRYRHDGWTPDRQVDFIEAFAACGCVDEAARSVGMSRNSAYALRRRDDAQAFRLAWEAASDYSVVRLADAAMARAIEGVPVPIFFNGEQVGERRHFDERLTMFLLRYRDPVRYGRWLDRAEMRRAQDGAALTLGFRIVRLMRAAWAMFDTALKGEHGPEPEPEPVEKIRRPDEIGR